MPFLINLANELIPCAFESFLEQKLVFYIFCIGGLINDGPVTWSRCCHELLLAVTKKCRQSESSLVILHSLLFSIHHPFILSISTIPLHTHTHTHRCRPYRQLQWPSSHSSGYFLLLEYMSVYVLRLNIVENLSICLGILLTVFCF